MMGMLRKERKKWIEIILYTHFSFLSISSLFINNKYIKKMFKKNISSSTVLS